jgi:hypothetical protein
MHLGWLQNKCTNCKGIKNNTNFRQITGIQEKLDTMHRNRLPRIIKHYSPTGRRNHGRPLKRLLDTWDRNGSTSGPSPWQIHDDGDDDDMLRYSFSFIGIPNDQFLSICRFKFYMLFLFPTLPIPLYPPRFRYPSNNSPHIIHFTVPLFRIVTIYWILPFVEFYFSWAKIAELFCPLVLTRKKKEY